MQPLTITRCSIVPFQVPFVRPFTFAGNTVSERAGYYLDVVASNDVRVLGEIAPLPGVSPETLKKAKHDLEEYLPLFSHWQVLRDRDDLITKIRKDTLLNGCCPSVRFGVESVLFELSGVLNVPNNVPSAVLLQGTHDEVIARAAKGKLEGATVFKLKVGDRNVALDVKKVQDLRVTIGKEGHIRLDGNRVWSIKEAVLFAQLVGNTQIEFIEEPLSDPSRLVEFYQTVHMPIALDETLAVLRPAVQAPGRCMPTLAAQDGVKAYVIKPMILGGVVTALDWIEEARRLGKKAIISSSFETQVGMRLLKALAALTDEVAGLGTQEWLNI